MATVTIKRLWKEYDDTVVLENLNLHVKDQEFVTIVGASGCGKITFLRLLQSPARTAASCFNAIRYFHT